MCLALPLSPRSRMTYSATSRFVHILSPVSTHSKTPQKVRERQEAAPAESETLQALVLNELKTGKHVATEGLVWLVRYVHMSMKTPIAMASLPFAQSA